MADYLMAHITVIGAFVLGAACGAYATVWYFLRKEQS